MNPRIPHHKVVIVVCASIISESEVSITVLCLLCSPHYTAVRIKKCLKSTSVLKNSHYEKYGRFLVTQRKPSRATTKLTFFTVSKMNGTQRRTLVSP